MRLRPNHKVPREAEPPGSTRAPRVVPRAPAWHLKKPGEAANPPPPA
ncbi:MAG: hypothetical protein JWL81_1999 [Verrucomicrobiales bacterium]|nr:hypothetical protein [Verrucomicrobiales bacterium]